jgi:peptide methionine sulfoxide reductase msrA/msrB
MPTAAPGAIRRADPGGFAAAFRETPYPVLRERLNSLQYRVTPENPFQADDDEDTAMPKTTESATLAGGCFWGMEEILRGIPGVVDTEVGYTGGHVENATYERVRRGDSGHAEAIRVDFDPRRISYEEILGYFFRMHDPTTRNRQGNDVGSQYRSAIFYHDDGQREVAERVKAAVDGSGRWENPIVTEIVPAGPFYSAEEHHQDYLQNHPNGYSGHFLRD